MKKSELKKNFAGLFLLIVLILPIVVNPIVGLATSTDMIVKSSTQSVTKQSVVKKKNASISETKSSTKKETLKKEDKQIVLKSASDILGNLKSQKNQKAFTDFYVTRRKDQENKEALYPVISGLQLGPEGAGSVTITIPPKLKYKKITPLAGWTMQNEPSSLMKSYQTNGKNNTAAEITQFINTIAIEAAPVSSGPVTNLDDVDKSVEIEVNSRGISSWIDPNGTRHYYEFVPALVSWYEAYNQAKRMKYKGLTGYLATVTSGAENNYIYKSIAKNPGWLGGIRSTLVDPPAARINDDPFVMTDETYYKYGSGQTVWYWACGPEATKPFYNGVGPNGSTPAGAFNFWASGEPNNSGNGQKGKYENALQFAKQGSNERWNDIPAGLGGSLPAEPFWCKGYYVEYSEYGDQKEVSDIGTAKAAIPKNVIVEHIDSETGIKIRGDETITGNEAAGLKMGQHYDAQDYVDMFVSANPRYSHVSSSQSLQGTVSDRRQVITVSYKKIIIPLDFHLVRRKDKENNETLHPVLSGLQASDEGTGSVAITVPDGINYKTVEPLDGWTTESGASSLTKSFQTNGFHNTPSEVMNFINGIELEPAVSNGSKVNLDDVNKLVEIEINSRTISSWTEPKGTRHYYEFVPALVSWYEAYNRAKKMEYKGLKGYLATITSSEENNYIYKSIAKNPGWLGGIRSVWVEPLRVKFNDESSLPTDEKNYYYHRGQTLWYWACGPEATQDFYIGLDWNGTTAPGAYSDWAPGEPNNNINGNQNIPENALQFAKKGSKEKWNDIPAGLGGSLPANAYWTEGYYVEFSEYGNQKELHDKDSATAAIPKNVMVAHVDEQTGKEIRSNETVAWDGHVGIKIGTHYDAQGYVDKVLSDYPQYSFNNASQGLKGQYSDTKKIITIKYKQKTAKIKANFVDQEGIPLQPSVTIDKPFKTTVDLTKENDFKNVIDLLKNKGYQVEKRPLNEQAFYIGNDEHEVDYVFKKKKATLVVHFEDEDNLPLKDPISLFKNQVDPIDLTSEKNVTDSIAMVEANGYKVKLRPNNEMSLKLTEANQSVTYTFEKNIATLNVKFVDGDDKDLQPIVKVEKRMGEPVNLKNEAEVTDRISKIVAEGYTVKERPKDETNIQLNFLNQTVAYVFEGHLAFVSVTSTLRFEKGKIFAQNQALKGLNDVKVEVKDKRTIKVNPDHPEKGSRGDFKVQATLTKPFTKKASDQKLTGAQLWYDQLLVGEQPVTLTKSQHDTMDKEKMAFNFLLEKGNAKNKGWYLHVPKGPEFPSEYDAEITWTLLEGP